MDDLMGVLAILWVGTMIAILISTLIILHALEKIWNDLKKRDLEP